MSSIKRFSDSYLFIFVVLILSILDLILLERKFNLFSGGFLLPERVASASARLVFVSTVLALELSLAGCFWYLLHIVGLIRGTPLRLSRYLFLFVYGGSSVMSTIIKYQILSYFGDFLSMAVLRNLGGGSAVSALGYGATEFLRFGAWLVPGLTGCWLCFKWLKARVLAMKESGSQTKSMTQLVLRMLGCIAFLFGISVAANANTTMRHYLPKITPFALARSVIDDLVHPEKSFIATLAATMPAHGSEPLTKINFGKRKDNLILIVSESTRADVLAAEVDGKPVTPTWRQLAREGAAADKYYSHTGFTSSSLKAIFLGSLGSRRPMGGSLFEVLKQNGYQIVVVSGQDESFGDIAKDSKETVADIFFDARSAKSERVFHSADPGSLTLSNARVVQEFDAVARRIDWSRPVFVYVNLQAAHFPYNYPAMPRTIDRHPLERSEISQESKTQLKQTYYNAVAFSDWASSRIIQRLKDSGVYDRSLVVVSGDHGESLFDDGILGHGIRIDDSQLHTLLVANRKLPAFGDLMGQTDLAAELLKGIGAEVDSNRPHRPILQLIGARTMPSELGYLYPDGTRLSIQNDNREIRADWLSAPLAADQVAPQSREYRELRKLVQEWKDHVAQ